MFKTCISVASVGKAPEIVKNMIDELGWPICTIVIETGRVSIYFYYKWYDYCHVHKIKKVVKECEERYRYYRKPDIYGKPFVQGKSFSSDEFKKAYARFAYEVIRRNLESKDGGDSK